MSRSVGLNKLMVASGAIPSPSDGSSSEQKSVFADDSVIDMDEADATDKTVEDGDCDGDGDGDGGSNDDVLDNEETFQDTVEGGEEEEEEEEEGEVTD